MCIHGIAAACSVCIAGTGCGVPVAGIAVVVVELLRLKCGASEAQHRHPNMGSNTAVTCACRSAFLAACRCLRQLLCMLRALGWLDPPGPACPAQPAWQQGRLQKAWVCTVLVFKGSSSYCAGGLRATAWLQLVYQVNTTASWAGQPASASFARCMSTAVWFALVEGYLLAGCGQTGVWGRLTV